MLNNETLTRSHLEVGSSPPAFEAGLALSDVFELLECGRSGASRLSETGP